MGKVKIKRILSLILCLLMVLSLFSCKEEETTDTTDATAGENTATTTKKPTSATDGKPTQIYEVTGKTYIADTTTINFGWEEGEEPTQIKKDTFKAFVKTEFGKAKITFTGEKSFELTMTNNGNHDIAAGECERQDNELFKALSQGTVDIIIHEDKVTFYCDFFASAWGMYFSMDFKSE